MDEKTKEERHKKEYLRENKKEERKENKKEEPIERKKESRRGARFWHLVVILAAITVKLNILACIQPLCDLYKRTVYGLISDCLGVLTGWFPVALGELLMYFGAIALVCFLIALMLWSFLRKHGGYGKFCKSFAKGVLFAATCLLLIYTLNWIIPFRGGILQVTGAVERGYTLEEVGKVRDNVTQMVNACALLVERDADGKVIYDRKAMDQSVFQAMRELATEYPLLSGYYPPMKTALCSDFLDWMNIGGYTYPYTMEITWNQYCNDLYYPFLLAHEASHHQGYYQENEANYLAFLACIKSEDPLVRYAGYNEIYYYINNAYYETAYDILGPDGVKADYAKRQQISELVRQDRRDASEAARKKYESKSHPAQGLSATASEVADVGWSVQGDILQENSYDGVVKMVLQYYDTLDRENK